MVRDCHGLRAASSPRAESLVGLRRERRDAPAVIVLGVLLLVCAVTLVGIAVHVGTHPAQARNPPERLAWPAGHCAVP